MATLQQPTTEAWQVESRAGGAEQATVTRGRQEHDLRNQLYLIGSFAELLRGGQFGPVSAQQQEFLNHILDCARHAQGLVGGNAPHLGLPAANGVFISAPGQ